MTTKKRKKKVSFWATKRVPVKKRITFYTSSGRKVSFLATVKVPKKVKVTFYVKRKKKRR